MSPDSPFHVNAAMPYILPRAIIPITIVHIYALVRVHVCLLKLGYGPAAPQQACIRGLVLVIYNLADKISMYSP